jgi:hypothetical protein
VADTLVIHKYRLPFHDGLHDLVEVPVRSGGFMHVAMQDGEVHVWAAVDPRAPEQLTRFRLVGTGSTVDLSWHHLGTVMDGPYVWHIYTEPLAVDRG